VSQGTLNGETLIDLGLVVKTIHFADPTIDGSDSKCNGTTRTFLEISLILVQARIPQVVGPSSADSAQLGANPGSLARTADINRPDQAHSPPKSPDGLPQEPARHFL
jgi:hypothetical protein